MSKNHAHGQYARTIRPLLPAAAFKRRPALVGYFAIHLLVIAACIVGASQWPIWASALLAIVAGHSFACIAFFAHGLSHGAVLRRGKANFAMEVVAWGMNLIPATLWDEVHNHVHHTNTNMVTDPDRRWSKDEATLGPKIYTHVLYPSAQTPRWNPLVFVQFLGYIARNVISALSGGHWGMLPATPAYTGRQRLRIAAELVAIAAMQVGILWCLDWNVWKWLLLVMLGQAVASGIVMAYVFTNHSLKPMQDENDPLAASTSVAVPRVVDWLHLNFSYHTEHHLFPAIDSRYMPELSAKLAEHFPAVYNRIPITQAWRELWRVNPYVGTKAH